MKMKIVTGFFIACVLICCASSAAAESGVYLFSNTGEYLKIDLDKGKVSGRGNLWDSNIYRVYSGVLNAKTNRIYLRSDYAVYVLNSRNMKLIKRIDLSGAPWDLINVIVSDDGKRFALWHYDADKRKDVNKLYDAKTFKPIKDLPCSLAYDDAHFAENGKILCFDVIGEDAKTRKRTVVLYDVKRGKKEKEVLLDMLLPGVTPVERVVEVASDRGRLLLLRRIDPAFVTKEKPVAMIKGLFVKDVLRDTGTGKGLRAGKHAEYWLFKDASMVALEEQEELRRVDALAEYAMNGKVEIYDAADSEKISSFELPKKGKIAGFSSSGANIYYLTPESLLIVDVQEGTVIKEIFFADKKDVVVQGKSKPVFNVPVFVP